MSAYKYAKLGGGVSYPQDSEKCLNHGVFGHFYTYNTYSHPSYIHTLDFILYTQIPTLKYTLHQANYSSLFCVSTSRGGEGIW